MKQRKIPLRMCVGCRQMKAKKEMLRIVKSPADGTLSLDLQGKKPGRGAYLCGEIQCFKHAVKTKQLERIFGVGLDPSVLDLLQSAMTSIQQNKAERG